MIAVIISLYSPVFQAHFVADDYFLWQTVRRLSLVDSLRLFLPPVLGGINTVVNTGHFVPLPAWVIWFITVPLQMNHHLAHSLSLLFHVGNTLLLTIFGFLLVKDKRATFISALIFATFPYITETVNYIAVAMYLLGTLFYLQALISVLMYQKYQKKIWIVVHLVSFYLALLSVEITITLPLAVLVLLVYNSGQSFAKTLLIDKDTKIGQFQIPSPRGILPSVDSHSPDYVRGYYLRGRFLVVRLYEVIYGYHRLFLAYVVLLLVYFGMWRLTLGNWNIFFQAGRFELTGGSRLFLLFLIASFFLILSRMMSSKYISVILKKRESLFWTLVVLIGITWLPTAKLLTQQRYIYLPMSFAALAVGYIFLIVYKSIRWQGLRRGLVLGFWILLTLQSLLVYQSSMIWFRAGKVANSILVQLEQKIHGLENTATIYLINIPDSIAGAFVHRSYFSTAYEYVNKGKPPEFIFTPMTIGSDTKAYIVSPNKIRLQSKEGFVLYKPTRTNAGLRMVEWPGVFRAVETDFHTLEVEFIQPQFSWQKIHAYIYVDGIINPVLLN